VALCRALLPGPQLLLADEPTGNLDPATAATVLDQLLNLARQSQASVIIVTHDPTIAERADRRLVLANGKLTQA
jgi:putative ABC transport system ATP-binding protein